MWESSRKYDFSNIFRKTTKKLNIFYSLKIFLLNQIQPSLLEGFVNLSPWLIKYLMEETNNMELPSMILLFWRRKRQKKKSKLHAY